MGVFDKLALVPALGLQLLIVAGLLRGHYRRYPLLLVLISADFLGTVVSVASVMDDRKWTAQTAKVYWLTVGLQYTLIFACQIQMLYQAIQERRKGLRIVYLVIGGLLYTVLAAWFSYHPRLNYWMTQLARNISFGSMLLNLGLWTTLLYSRDRQRLMITASLGFMLAGDAIGHSLRQISRSYVFAGNMVLMIMYFLYLFTLWRTVRKDPQQVDEQATHDPLAQVHLSTR
jgi:hypothetical protein